MSTSSEGGMKRKIKFDLYEVVWYWKNPANLRDFPLLSVLEFTRFQGDSLSVVKLLFVQTKRDNAYGGLGIN